MRCRRYSRFFVYLFTIPWFIFPAGLSGQENRRSRVWYFSQAAGVQVPLTECNEGRLRTGTGFDAQFSCQLTGRWQAFLMAGWNDFRISGAGHGQAVYSAGLGEVQGGVRYEGKVTQKLCWFVLVGGGVAKSEFYSEYGNLAVAAFRIPGYSGSAGVNMELAEGLSLGYVARISHYVKSGNVRAAADRVGIGIIVRGMLW